MDWHIQKNQGPIYQEIMEKIISEGEKGNILLGEKLPAERELAKIFQVNRSTVTRAIDELQALGMIEKVRGSGNYLIALRNSPELSPWRFLIEENDYFFKPELFPELKNNQEAIDAYTGELPYELVPKIQLPSFSWKDFLKAEKKEDHLGYVPLRKVLGKELKEKKENILITAGSQQGLFLILQGMLQKGDKVGIFSPSFFWSLPIFSIAQVKRIGIPFSGKIDFFKLKEIVLREKIKVLIVNPNFQNPTGVQMSLKERKTLVDFAKSHHLLIIEDDAFSKLYYPETKKLSTLRQLGKDNVLYLGSLSKILGTTTKIGWVVGPPPLMDRLSKVKEALDFSLSIFPQVMAYSALTSQNYPLEMAALREKLKKRGTDLFQLSQKYHFKATMPKGGYYLWLEELPVTVNENFLKKLAKENIYVAGGYLFAGGKHSLRVNASRLTKKEGEIFMEKLAKVIAQEKNNILF